jgi:hypothetical protein
MSKKSYMSLLKEAIAEFDTSDNLEVKGPMLDPILSWDGDGEIPVYKDAASILERYYFNEDQEKSINTLDESDYENDKGSSKGDSMKNAEGAGTEQAGTSDSDTVLGGKKEKAKDIAKEAEEMADDDDAEEVEEKALGKEAVKNKKYTEEDLEMENAIIEKLIAEMEDDDDDDDEKGEEEGMEEAEVMSYTGDEPKVKMPKEKKAKGPEEDTKGAGTEQAGTGTDAGQIPPRKDMHDQMVKPKKYTDENTQIEEALAALEAELNEADEEMADDAEDKEVEKDLDVDKEMAKEAASAVPGGPSPKKRGEDWESDEAAYSEAFSIFKEAIKDEEEEKEEEEGKE